MNRSAVEPILGAVILLVAAAFLIFAYDKATTRSVGAGYDLQARFSAIDGLSKGGDVRISGVKVGQIADITIEPKTFLAVVTMRLEQTLQLPTDTVASVTSDGLLGGKFLALEPGSDDDRIPPGGRIDRTQSAASLDKLLGQVIFSLQNLGGNKDGNAAPAAPGAPAPAPAPAAPATARPN
jgi:phospholipid/cholesterol/gamma-HCH transport system substrate-binding protein